ncbi:hypothetical protein YB2330_003862 [Saitoella coloradoensis]
MSPTHIPVVFKGPVHKAPVKGAKKTLDPSEVNSMIQHKISQLETNLSQEEQEEREIAREVQKANKELTQLLSTHDDQLEKINVIQRKYSSLLQDMHRLEREHVRAKAKSEQMQKEKDAAKGEMNKALGMKHKLEALCRELQKENKRIKDESKRLAQSEQEKREELSTKFESTIWEIKSKMEEDTDEKHKRRLEDNEFLKEKFKSFLEQYELRETHFHAVLRAKDLELQLNQARAEQQRCIAESESSRAKTLHAQVSTFSQTETELRSQLNIYVEKFKQVEDTLNNSNDLFLTFRKEMEQMTKKTKKLEKENAAIRAQSETLKKNILELAEERTKHQKELEAGRKKHQKLENLCRALQAERTALESKLALYEHPALMPEGAEDEDAYTVSEDDYTGDEDEQGEYEEEKVTLFNENGEQQARARVRYRESSAGAQGQLEIAPEVPTQQLENLDIQCSGRQPQIMARQLQHQIPSVPLE